VTDQYVGEIRATGFNFAPTGWALCDGQILAISSNAALFSLLGTFYGGNGTSTFQLPDLRGACPLSQGQGSGLSPFFVGESGGVPTVTLVSQQMASHQHVMAGVAGAGTSDSPTNNSLAESRSGRVGQEQYGTGVSLTSMNPRMLALSGGSGAHNNMPPYLVINFIIALTGIFPSRS
jgi:microcystin-dependent protein